MKLVIWGETAGQAEFVRQALGLGTKDVVCVGPRNPDRLRGLSRVDAVLILADAKDTTDQDVAMNLAVIDASSQLLTPTIDLRS